MNNLNTKMDRIDAAIAEMRKNLSLSTNAEIEEVASSTTINLKKIMNVYIQEEQPSTFEGIWIQQEAEEWEHLIVDEDIAKMGEFEATGSNLQLHTQDEKWIWCDGYIYGIDPSVSPMAIYKYTDTQPQTLVATYSVPTDIFSKTSSNCISFSYNRKIYAIRDTAWIEFNPITEEFRQMPDIGVYVDNWNNMNKNYAIHENSLYFFSDNKSGVFNFLTEKVSSIPSRGWNSVNKSPFTLSPVIGNRIYLIISTTQAVYGMVQYYDIETKTYGSDAMSQAMQSCQLDSGCLNNAVVHGEYMYVLYAKYNKTNGLRRINIKDNSIEQLATLPFTTDGNIWTYSYEPVITFLNNKLFITPGKYANRQVHSISNDTSAYEDKTLVLTQGKLYNSTLETGLYTVPVPDKGRVVWPFYDINYYKNGNFSTVPMYYGNGTEWIRFKN